MKKYANSIISLLLVISLLIAMLPVSALAESMSLETEMPTVQDELSVETEPAHQIISEDVSRRDEYYKEFILDSGLRMASLCVTQGTVLCVKTITHRTVPCVPIMATDGSKEGIYGALFQLRLEIAAWDMIHVGY